MKKLLKDIHLWLSLPFGVIIMIMCITGAILVLKTEWLQIFTPNHFYTESVQEHRLPLSEIIPKVKRQLPAAMELSSVTMYKDEDLNYSFGVQGMHHAEVMVDPYTGSVRDLPSEGGFFSGVMQLHRWFFISPQRDGISWGKLITGISTLLFAIILITGIIIWIPKNIKMLKNNLTIKWSKGGYRRWYDFHQATGIYSAIFLLAFCLTGLTWSFDWYKIGFYKVLGVEASSGFHGPGGPKPAMAAEEKQPMGEENKASMKEGSRPSMGENRPDGQYRKERRGNRPERSQRGSDNDKVAHYDHGDAGKTNVGERHGEFNSDKNNEDTKPQQEEHGFKQDTYAVDIDYRVWDKVVNNLMEKNQNYSVISIQNGSASIAFDGAENTRSGDRYSFDAATGTITDVKYFKDNQDRASKLRGWIYKIHVGSWGGLFSKILSFIACLIGATLCVTGYYMYFKRLSKKKSKSLL